ncbi:MAG: hypothetical protein ACK5IP_12550 [Paracoccus sp. (in: a-proteobacteria)]
MSVLPHDCRNPTEADLAVAVDLALAHPDAPDRVLGAMAARLADVPQDTIDGLPPIARQAMIDRAGLLVTEGQDRQVAAMPR